MKTPVKPPIFSEDKVPRQSAAEFFGRVFSNDIRKFIGQGLCLDQQG
jgi:hypothetical protein